MSDFREKLSPAKVEAGAPDGARRREQGLWSFLTRSMWLAQVLAAEQLAATMARAAEDAESAKSASNAESANGVSASLPGEPDVTHAGEENVATEAAALQDTDANRGAAESLDAPVQGRGAANVDNTSASLSDVIMRGANGGGHGGGQPPLSPPGGHGVDLDLPGVGATPPPVLDELPGVLGGTVGQVVEVLGDVLDQTVSSLLGAVGGVAGALDGVLDRVVAPAVAGLTHTVGPVVSVAGSLVGDLVQSIHGQDSVASAGQFVFPNAPVLGGAGSYELFAGGHYTNYGLELHAGTSSGIGATVQASAGAQSSLMNSTIVGAEIGGATDGGDNHRVASSVTVPSALEEIELRGLGDGIV